VTPTGQAPNWQTLCHPRYLLVFIAFALIWPIAQLPAAWLDYLGHMLGHGFYRFAKRRKAIIKVNLALCFPELSDSARENLLRENLLHTGMALTDGLQALWRIRPLSAKRLQITGAEQAQHILSHGQGAVIYSAHYLTMLLTARALSQALGRPVHQLVRQHNNLAIEFLIDWGRRRSCAKTIGKKQLPELLRSLRAGHPVAMVCDQNFNYRMAFIDFLGVPAATLTIVPKLVRSSGAPLIPIASWRTTDGILHVDIGGPLANFPSLDATQSADISDTARLIALIETHVRRFPAQYLWAHRRFKTRPEGKLGVYE
jgi:Kdo2-lipid IVA lauroyltransferase/acyltransferase